MRAMPFQEHWPGKRGESKSRKHASHQGTVCITVSAMSRKASQQNLRTTRLTKGSCCFENLLPLKDDAEKDLEEALPALHAAVQRSRTFESQYVSIYMSQDFVDCPWFSCHTCCTPMRTFTLFQLKGSLLEQATGQTHSGGLDRKMQNVDLTIWD